MKADRIKITALVADAIMNTANPYPARKLYAEILC